ncbi:excinuclease ABC subunit C [bacterium CG_4_9_14_3_um_filter_65_15]|nr:MAG: excinuclease ABC subunit C [bacterium CG_4_9_14_3_um_filter_65_15]
MMSRRRDPESDLKNKLASLPAAPGVYLHKNRDGKVIYVGKASRLNQRVRSYFGGESEDKDPKTRRLVSRIHDFDFIATDNEAQALVLENQLIKEYRPYYNIRLKDDKQYPYLRISVQEAFPRVTVVRGIQDDGARYFGPFTDVGAMRETLAFAAGAFQIRTCHLDLPEQTVRRPCLDWQIGRCSAPCVDYEDATAYGKRVAAMIGFLEGRTEDLLTELQERMQTAARVRRYEEAARLRDLRAKLKKTAGQRPMVEGVRGNADLCGVAREGTEASGIVLRVRGGHILTSHHFPFTVRLDAEPAELMAQLLREYYDRAGEIPREILLGGPLDGPASWQDWLGDKRGGPVHLLRPQRGDKLAAVEMARSNAQYHLRETLVRAKGRSAGRNNPTEIQLQEALDLHTPPHTIECFDISNFQGKETVASLVFFSAGKPLKSRYRRFRIKTVQGVDDFASMAEVLGRYYGRLVEREQPPADLVMVDGGAGQLSVAREVLGRYGFHRVQLIGLAKKEEIVHREGGTVRLPRHGEALRLLQRVRDEAHRFAITYHRSLRDKLTTASELDLIPGIGEVKKLSLLHHFGSVTAVRAASPEALAEVRGLNRHDVVSVLAYYANRGDSA